MTDPRQLRPGELCRLLNSTPLGEVLKPSQLQAHRNRAGLRIGDSKHVDLVRYVTWLVLERHGPRPTAPNDPADDTLTEAAESAAAVACRGDDGRGHGEKFSRQQEAAIAALLTEPTYAAAARKAGLGESTLYRWMRKPAFRAACQTARRELVATAAGRLKVGAGQAVETLLAVAKKGRRDGDRVRASVALLDHAFRGPGDDRAGKQNAEMPLGPADVVRLLADRLRQVDAADWNTPEKARLTATLADAYLRAVGVDELARRLHAIEAVLAERPKTVVP